MKTPKIGKIGILAYIKPSDDVLWHLAKPSVITDLLKKATVITNVCGSRLLFIVSPNPVDIRHQVHLCPRQYANLEQQRL